MISTGMRPSETLNLKRADLACRPDEIEIVGKGKKKRVIYLNERVYHWLDRYLIKRSDNHPALFVTHNMTIETRPLNRRTAEYLIQQLREKAGIKKKIVPHTLRHTFATHYAGNGCVPDYIARMLGHSSAKTTRKYYIAITQKYTKDAHRRYNPFCNWDSSNTFSPPKLGMLPSPTN